MSDYFKEEITTKSPITAVIFVEGVLKNDPGSPKSFECEYKLA
jgi:hypothetical protein